MAVAKRIIPCLDVNKGRVVKGINFKELKDAGLIKGDIDGPRICYCVDPAEWKLVSKYLNEFLALDPSKSPGCC